LRLLNDEGHVFLGHSLPFRNAGASLNAGSSAFGKLRTETTTVVRKRKMQRIDMVFETRCMGYGGDRR
jgi:hypothetical protein